MQGALYNPPWLARCTNLQFPFTHERDIKIECEVLKMKGMPLMCSNVEVKMLKDEMQKLKDKQTFVASWDPQTMLPPFTDVVMQATDGRLVHSHASTLVGS